MKKEICFTPLNLQTWQRGAIFYYFSKIAPTGYALTVDLDVTKMRAFLKTTNLKFFPAYLWLTTKVLNMQIEFKIAEKDGQIGYFETITPLYATFHDAQKTFSLMWTEYNDDFMTFYDAYMQNKAIYGNNPGILAQTDLLPPENAYTISCIPWVSFKHFSVHSYENKPYYFPSIEAGQFYKKDGKSMMPFSITCHHAATDGYHISRFLGTWQSLEDNFAENVHESPCR